jgi:hypothetical protein
LRKRRRKKILPHRPKRNQLPNLQLKKRRMLKSQRRLPKKRLSLLLLRKLQKLGSVLTDILGELTAIPKRNARSVLCGQIAWKPSNLINPKSRLLIRVAFFYYTMENHNGNY